MGLLGFRKKRNAAVGAIAIQSTATGLSRELEKVRISPPLSAPTSHPMLTSIRLPG